MQTIVTIQGGKQTEIRHTVDKYAVHKGNRRPAPIADCRLPSLVPVVGMAFRCSEWLSSKSISRRRSHVEGCMPVSAILTCDVASMPQWAARNLKPQRRRLSDQIDRSPPATTIAAPA